MTDKPDATLDRPEVRQHDPIFDAAIASSARRVSIVNTARTRALIAASRRATEDLKAAVARSRQSIAETRELLATLREPYAPKRLRGERRLEVTG